VIHLILPLPLNILDYSSDQQKLKDRLIFTSLVDENKLPHFQPKKKLTHFQLTTMLFNGLPDLITTLFKSDQIPILVFFHSIEPCVSVAKKLAETKIPNLPTYVDHTGKLITSKDLIVCPGNGIGFHHSKMTDNDKQKVEDLHQAGNTVHFEQPMVKTNMWVYYRSH
jgi:hypothetical protein